MNNFEEINKVHSEILDLLDRTYYVIEIKKYPTWFQRFVARLIFKQKIKTIIKDNI